MKFAVIGATGYVGSAVIKELALRKHQVTAFARNINNIVESDYISAVATDVNSSEFSKQLEGFDAILSAFNPGWHNPNIGSEFTQGANAIVEAAKKANTPYLLVVGGAGSLYLSPDLQLIDSKDFPKEIYDGANAARHHLTNLLTRHDINWAFISPPALLGKEAGYSEKRTGEYRLGKDNLLMAGEAPAGISVADLAIAIADDLEQKKHLHQRFTVASA